MNWARVHYLYFAWLIALIGMLVSLYYGEVLHLEPCRLCWYQRIAIFPLALFLGIAAYKNERKIARYCLPLIAFGGIVAVYQFLIHLFPQMHSHYLCGAHECTIAGVPPALSVIGFALMAFFVLRADAATN